MGRKFLVAVDGSDHGWKALDLAVDQAKTSGVELIIVHVAKSEPVPDAIKELSRAERVPIAEETARYYASKEIGDKIIKEAKGRVGKTEFTRYTTRVAHGNVSNQIVRLAELEGVETIFIGSRGLGDVKGLLMGSISHKVMNLAPCTCVAVR